MNNFVLFHTNYTHRRRRDTDPLAATPLTATPLAATPLAATPLAATPLAATHLATTPLAAAPLAAAIAPPLPPLLLLLPLLLRTSTDRPFRPADRRAERPPAPAPAPALPTTTLTDRARALPGCSGAS